jgi:hypothetical protein
VAREETRALTEQTTMPDETTARLNTPVRVASSVFPWVPWHAGRSFVYFEYLEPFDPGRRQASVLAFRYAATISAVTSFA